MSKQLDITLDLENLCTICAKDTSFGSGLFVNRIPCNTDSELLLGGKNIHVTVEGYKCYDCQLTECDICDTKTEGTIDNAYGQILCDECATKRGIE
tara:strand:- start:218 stop:505 length:288 start_codon:yes stop_codon:yes gene_type:complete